MRDHGGNLHEAIARWGGTLADWIDLSTGINRVAYPLPALPPEVWTALPSRTARDRLVSAAADAYGTTAAILPVAGAQAAIQMVPRLTAPGRARVLSPTYNEHAGALRAAGWQVEDVATIDALAGADLAIVVNPNNPDGRSYQPATLLDLAGRVGRLVVDESFADPRPALSVAAQAGNGGMLVLRSFGKFYGLAGLRLGFVLGTPADIEALDAMAGPWPVPGAALEIGRVALRDRDWADATTRRLTAEVPRIDGIGAGAGWTPLGGAELFRLFDTPDATAAQARLARARIWSRIFPYSPGWLRLGLPGSPAEWAWLEEALRP